MTVVLAVAVKNVGASRAVKDEHGSVRAGPRGEVDEAAKMRLAESELERLRAWRRAASFIAIGPESPSAMQDQRGRNYTSQ